MPHDSAILTKQREAAIMSDGYTESTIEVAGLPIQVRRGGDGPSILVIHHETGNPGWLEFHNALSANNDVILPTLPGWDGTERGDWMRSVRDLAAVCSLVLDELGVGDATVVGLGFGGYIAAEMATANQSRITSLVLVNAMGLQPSEGEIRDQFLEAHADYVKSCFADPATFDALYGEEVSTEQLIDWDANREMTARVAWKPFLYSQTLPHLLKNVTVKSKVIRGTGDTVVPSAAAQQYVELLGDAELIEIPGGHNLESDAAEALAEAIVG
ncbi:MAG: alpha/beta hydrolase [Chloroflexi bacterium]|nr:alpha/beta hydrolase [Chloroflexota bacterium]